MVKTTSEQLHNDEVDQQHTHVALPPASAAAARRRLRVAAGRQQNRAPSTEKSLGAVPSCCRPPRRRRRPPSPRCSPPWGPSSVPARGPAAWRGGRGGRCGALEVLSQSGVWLCSGCLSAAAGPPWNTKTRADASRYGGCDAAENLAPRRLQRRGPARAPRRPACREIA